jgi:hypothetical protein
MSADDKPKGAREHNMSDLQEILETLTEQTSLRMMNMKLAPEITAAEIVELEKQAQDSIYAMGLRVLETDEQRKAWHIACYGIGLTRKDDL